jgi:GTP cyclohydrolase IA
MTYVENELNVLEANMSVMLQGQNSESQSSSRPSFDLARIRAAVREILIAIGDDPDREGVLDTPSRVARAYAEILGGLREDAATHLARTFEQDTEDVVMLRDIEFTSVCEHHLLPVFGRAHVAYKPSKGRVVGLSKLARTVDVFARRPQLQERMTAQVADALMTHLEPAGALVVVEAEHMCMKMRGVRKSEPVMCTVAHRGVFSDDRQLRQEVLAMFGASRGADREAGWADEEPRVVNAAPRLRPVGDAEALDGEAC